jgi:methionyl-tRNA synthetase
MSQKPFYITTPIYYVNDVPHIGHAYTTLACDMAARFMRLDGRPVFFATGTDEHGQKNAKTAQAHGRDPQDHVDLLSENFRHLCAASHMSNDDFIRTTEPRHKKAAQAMWKALDSNGHIYLGKYDGWYSTSDEAYYGESEIADGKAIASGSSVEWVEEPSYFFKLSSFQDQLLAHYAANPDFIAPKSRYNEVVKFVESGLRDLSISRTNFNWGVPVPGDDAHIMYVWLDALTNYLTCLGYPDESAANYKTFWPEALHVMGKDILRFHAVYWPAFLMAAGLPLPRQIFAHGWWTNEGQKISKSVGNAIDPHKLFEAYGLDQVRYFLMREVPFGQDGDFSHQALVSRMNGDLANDYGNLVHRVLSFLDKQLQGVLPALAPLTAEDEAILAQARALLPHVRELMNKMALSKALEEIWTLVSAANRYIDAQKPWGLKVSDPARMATILAVLVDVIRRIALLTQPVMPDASAKILDLLCVDPQARTFAQYDTPLAAGTQLAKPYCIFQKWEEPDAG